VGNPPVIGRMQRTEFLHQRFHNFIYIFQPADFRINNRLLAA